MKNICTLLAAVLLTATTYAQVGINNENPDASAALDITSTTGGFLPPRMTNAQRQAISNPAAGLQVFVTDFDGGSVMLYNGTEWGTLSFTKKRPDAPIIGTATLGNAQATVPFTAPSSDGGSAITSYTATSSPGGITGTLSQSGSGSITVTGLTNATAYTFTVTATNAIGTSLASAASNSVIPAPEQVGDFHQGGVVFYIFESGDTGYIAGETHGLIAAPSDQSSATWGCSGQSIGGTSYAVGTGAANTTAIVSGCSETAIAARICADLTLGVYDDWFLPSKDELYFMYLNRATIDTTASANEGSNFSTGAYWSSTENGSNTAYAFAFGGAFPGLGSNNKTTTTNVRAVRAF